MKIVSMRRGPGSGVVFVTGFNLHNTRISHVGLAGPVKPSLKIDLFLQVQKCNKQKKDHKTSLSLHDKFHTCISLNQICYILKLPVDYMKSN
jgi:hypothetical protein